MQLLHFTAVEVESNVVWVSSGEKKTKVRITTFFIVPLTETDRPVNIKDPIPEVFFQ